MLILTIINILKKKEQRVEYFWVPGLSQPTSIGAPGKGCVIPSLQQSAVFLFMHKPVLASRIG